MKDSDEKEGEFFKYFYRSSKSGKFVTKYDDHKKLKTSKSKTNSSNKIKKK
jgi:hypothetical protein